MFILLGRIRFLTLVLTPQSVQSRTLVSTLIYRVEPSVTICIDWETTHYFSSSSAVFLVLSVLSLIVCICLQYSRDLAIARGSFAFSMSLCLSFVYSSFFADIHYWTS
jgi:hypothetical protein